MLPRRMPLASSSFPSSSKVWINVEICLLIAALLTAGSSSIFVTKLQIPSFIKAGDSAKLECEYEVEYDGLYSVKWYKDKREFYSYTPRREDQPKRFFAVPGVDVMRDSCDSTTVYLRNVSLETSGEYKCQVSGEGPLFSTVHETKTLRVAVLPESPPYISGVPARYGIGDWLHLNCTSESSNPPARLTWIVNEKEASDRMVLRFPYIRHPLPGHSKDVKSYNQSNSLTTTVHGLQFWVKDHHFGDDGRVKVKCRAEIPHVYSSETDTFTVGEYTLPDRVMQAISGAAVPFPDGPFYLSLLLSVAINYMTIRRQSGSYWFIHLALH